MPEQMDGELTPQQFAQERLQTRAAILRVGDGGMPGGGAGQFPEMQMRRQHRRSLDARQVALRVVAGQTVRRGNREAARVAPASPGVQVARRPPAQSGCAAAGPRRRAGRIWAARRRRFSPVRRRRFGAAGGEAGPRERRVDAVGGAGLGADLDPDRTASSCGARCRAMPSSRSASASVRSVRRACGSAAAPTWTSVARAAFARARNFLERRAAAQHEGRAALGECGGQGVQAVMQPPARGAARCPAFGGRIVENEDRQHAPPHADGGVQSRVVGQAQIMPEPQQDGAGPVGSGGGSSHGNGASLQAACDGGLIPPADMRAN